MLTKLKILGQGGYGAEVVKHSEDQVIERVEDISIQGKNSNFWKQEKRLHQLQN